MNNWIEFFSYSISGAAQLLSAMGLWFAAIIPGIDRWSKRFFLHFFHYLFCYFFLFFHDLYSFFFYQHRCSGMRGENHEMILQAAPMERTRPG